MKRSQADEDKDLSGRALLEKHAQLERDLEFLRSEQTKTTKELEDLAKRTIAENMGTISPFRDTFVQKLGTIVDFGEFLRGFGDVSMLVERGPVDDEDYDGLYWIRYDSTNADIIVTTADAVKHDSIEDIACDPVRNSYMRHVFSNNSKKWHNCSDIECACHKENSDTRALQALVATFPWAIIALMHDMVRLYDAFIKDPKKKYDDIVNAASTNKKKKRKKDEKKK